MSNVNESTTQGYPLNLLDNISPNGEWEYALPADFMPSLAYVLALLTDREQTVIEKRYKEHRTYEDIGKEFGVTRERIRQVEQKALRKLSHQTRRKILQYGVREYYLNSDINTAMREITRAANAMNRIVGAIESTDGAVDTMKDIAKQIADERKSESIEKLDLSVRSYNCLKRANITTLEDLSNISEKQLKKVRNLGLRGCEEIKAKMREYGLELKADDEQFADGE